MNITRTITVIIFLSFLPITLFPSIVIIYVDGNRIIFTCDSRIVKTENGKDIYSTDKSCKIRIVNNYALAMVGTIEGFGPIKYNAWDIVQKVFNKYNFEEARILIKNEFMKILPSIGQDLSITDPRFKIVSENDGPIILSLAIVKNENDSLKLLMIHFAYLLMNGEPNIKVIEFFDIATTGRINYYPLGTELTLSQKSHIENNVDLNSYDSMSKVIDLVAENNSRLVGGGSHILEINKNGFKWKPNDTCQ